ncbi:hypothetical protein I0Q91_03830 [Halanaerobiaceae bacterium Z-7014]|uniref:Uncharacterized protein n=1 Tax=Halonatronomonas betaini TaxID=2778430 RepID=A0A931F862_9FIRM|nr:hypothetical protein [Halonatronomonas betaini]MBF8436198.1 hypothetical protein [Halonatronomonas betaini]
MSKDNKKSNNIKTQNDNIEEENKDIDLNFEWYSKELGAPLVSVASYGLTFSKSAVKKLGKPHSIKIGFDRTNKLIVIKTLEASESDEDSFEFADKKREEYGHVRLNNKGFIKLLISETEYDFEETLRFVLKRYNESPLYILDLKMPVNN